MLRFSPPALAAACAALLGAALPAHAQTDAYTYSDASVAYVQNNGQGFTFTPAADGLFVSSLGLVNLFNTTAYGLYGVQNHDAGTSYADTVYLDANAAPGVHLAQATVTVDGSSADPFVYSALSLPVALISGTAYTVYVLGRDPYATAGLPYERTVTVSADPRIGYGDSVYSYNYGFPGVDNGAPNADVNFQFTQVTAAPEPSGAAALLLGALGLAGLTARRRAARS